MGVDIMSNDSPQWLGLSKTDWFDIIMVTLRTAFFVRLFLYIWE
jgi:hypothetical protein